jgi:hypothetical protein
LVKGNYRCKIAHRNNKINKNAKRFNMGRLKEPNITNEYQQQLGKEFEKIEKEGAGEKLTHVDEEWKQLKEAIVKTVEHTIGYHPKPDKRGWFDEERKKKYR